MKSLHFFSLLLALGVSFPLFFGGCASVSVYETKALSVTERTKLPQKILVRGFSTPEAAFRVDRGGYRLERFQQEKQERLTRHLVRRLSRSVAPAEAIATTAPTPKGDIWLLEGQFDRVNQGSRALRSIFGFGFGGTKMETTATLSDLAHHSPQRIYQVQTTGGSGAEPGAIAGLPMWWGVGINAILAARAGLVFDTVRTSREITAALSEYSHQQGLIPEKEALTPKRAGRLPEGIYRWLPFLPGREVEPDSPPSPDPS